MLKGIFMIYNIVSENFSVIGKLNVCELLGRFLEFICYNIGLFYYCYCILKLDGE